jgi:hypothetical protein
MISNIKEIKSYTGKDRSSKSSKLSEFWEYKIYKPYISEIFYFFKDIKLGIQNLIKWFWVIWKDRDWDDYYIFEILQKKIENQSKYISQRDFHTLSQRDSEIMDICSRLLERVKTEYYQTEYFDYHQSEMNFIPTEDGKGYTVEFNEKWENFIDYFEKYPLVYKKVLKGEGIFDIKDETGEDIKNRIAMNMAHLNHERARKLLFSIMERNIEKWWD